MSHYPARYTFDEACDEYDIQYRDFPDSPSVAYQHENIELAAREGIKNSIAAEMEAGRTIPAPSALQPGDIAVHVPILVRMKVELHNALLATNTDKADMARKLGLNADGMLRLLDVGYASKVEVLEQALYLLGLETDVMMRKVN
ncbi:type II toxin-antitoxin system HicB family antitoxin [Yersinia pekkanenii]|uniref:Antitoxin HicB n=1 Tax=Yersinia pekkanenii TaxID=1288385 RepID=A0A0T9QUU2_9GAMM|nr:antitoxin HicB [Yersinia pekkanenii]CNI29911.1 Antitoxin HicB [Yersinia pekkanenii]CRY63778.1 Antitoxin HicB [Yersinia pekkanenii]